MAKAVIYALVAAAFVLLITLGPSEHRHNSSGGGHSHFGRVNRRFGNRSRALVFDPLVAKIERYSEGKGSSNHEDGVDDDEVEQYIGSEGTLNITLRLMIVFPMLDKSPKDGFINSLELNNWVRNMAVERLNQRTKKEMISHDQNHDGSISFLEYLPQFSDEDIEKNEMGHGEAGWWKQQFINADIDHNGTLSLNEFKDLLHPEDSDNEEIKKWLLKEKLEVMDSDKDGKLNFMEFCEHAYEIYKNYVEYETSWLQVSSAEEKFAELDINKDKFLGVEELIPILSYLHPGELSYAKYYAGYLMKEADDNKDGKLTLEEMLNHESIFYSTVYNDDTYEDFEDDFHDEL
ncbi:uncharacterized protein LOC115715727 [Cannabis sativa]|uniref:uncharacterized protein LOC115715727 n=1 Tax=Cannabis sativa TaxID=3483 RepID=UPI0029CA3EA2|nr:uncharacterized protein LOC115715727 [Cannabis sativa]